MAVRICRVNCVFFCTALVGIVVADDAVVGATKGVPMVISTDSGQLSGRVNSTIEQTACDFFPLLKWLPWPVGAPNVAAFLGIPYASAPTLDNRWRPPQPFPAWKGVRQANAVGPECAQLPANSLVKVPDLLHGSVDEDCLFLNIWAPVEATGSFAAAKLPILIFFHGGGYVGGSGYQEENCAFYNGQQLAADTGVIIVTLNYRVGLFGFMADPVFRGESGTTGNYGLQDQRAALSWIKRNAASFGGDASKITIWGQSAGATSVLHHAILPRSRDMFSQGISMSGYGITWPLNKAYTIADQIAADVKCEDKSSRATCLRKVSAESLLEAEEHLMFGGDSDMTTRMMFWGPVSDGFELPENTTFEEATRLAKPTAPLLIGSTANESNLLQCTLSNSMTDTEVTDYLVRKATEFIPGFRGTAADFQEILKEYPAFPTPRETIMAFSTDLLFTCSAERAARFFTESGAPVYKYLLTRPPEMFKVVKCLGAAHVSGVFLLFSGAFPKQAAPFIVGDAVERSIKQGMTEAWSNFARHGSPGPNWPKWTDAEPTLQLGNETSADFFLVDGYRKKVCSMIDQLIDPLVPRNPESILV